MVMIWKEVKARYQLHRGDQDIEGLGEEGDVGRVRSP
jgi:hypothetical protein